MIHSCFKSKPCGICMKGSKVFYSCLKSISDCLLLSNFPRNINDQIKSICCVFWLAFRCCCLHLKASQNVVFFSTVFHRFTFENRKSGFLGEVFVVLFITYFRLDTISRQIQEYKKHRPWALASFILLFVI